jgi:hypothetical protein
LYNARHYWLPQLRLHYPDEEGMRILLLGLKRDERTDEKVRRERRGGSDGKCMVSSRDMRGIEVDSTSKQSDTYTDDAEDWEYVCVMPEEGLQTARHMGVDRYAECSAETGELMYEVVEDITRMAAKTTVEDGRENSGSCDVM